MVEIKLTIKGPHRQRHGNYWEDPVKQIHIENIYRIPI